MSVNKNSAKSLVTQMSVHF